MNIDFYFPYRNQPLINKVLSATYTTHPDLLARTHKGNQRLLYCSDLYQPKGRNGKYWQPHYAWEVYHSIKEYKIPATKFYAMHMAVLKDVAELIGDFD